MLHSDVHPNLFGGAKLYLEANWQTH